MKREAVQEERQRTKDRGDNEVESSTGSGLSLLGSMMMAGSGGGGGGVGNSMVGMSMGNASSPVHGHDTFLQAIHEAELLMEIKIKQENIMDITEAFTHQAMQLFRWARMIPHFGDLPLDDQCLLIKKGWNELHIAACAHRSVDSENVLVLANGICFNEQAAKNTGIAEVFQRVLTELVSKMREMQMDRTELGCLRAVVLFNPGKTLLIALQWSTIISTYSCPTELKSLKQGSMVEQYRDKVYSSLEEHCKLHYPMQPGRFAKLLLRLPALRSIGLKCVEQLFYGADRKEPIGMLLGAHLDLFDDTNPLPCSSTEDFIFRNLELMHGNNLLN